jgi:hypothetical protein
MVLDVQRFLNLITQYYFAIVDLPHDVPVQPVASEGIHTICPQATVPLYVQPVL